MDAFIGEIRAFTYSFIPQGWLACNGQTFSQQQQAALYSIIGTYYGGSGTNFNLPNLNGLAVIGAGSGPGLTPRPLGQQSGTESVALTSANQLPAHTHTLTMEQVAKTTIQASTTAAPVANSSWLSRPVQVTGASTLDPIFSFTQSATGVNVDTTLHPSTVGSVGNGVAHENRQPYLTLVYCICTDGTYPVRP